MPFYSVVLHGEGIRLRFQDGTHAVGFFATRVVKAKSAEEAVLRAKRKVEAQWAGPDFAPQNIGTPPQLTTEEVKEISVWQALRIPSKGHSFYADK